MFLFVLYEGKQFYEGFFCVKVLLNDVFYEGLFLDVGVRNVFKFFR